MQTQTNKDMYQLIIDHYPPVITKDQLYRICHISKRTACYLLESGLLPSVTNGKKTRKYKIQTTDVVEFLKLRDKAPERFLTPKGWYAPHKPEHLRWIPLSLEETHNLETQYKMRMLLYPDVLTSSQAAKVTHVVHSTITKWCRLGKLKHFTSGTKIMIPQPWLLEFMMSPQYLSKFAVTDRNQLADPNIHEHLQ